MRKLKFIISLVTCSFALYSQTDTLVTVNGKKVPVNITEITDKDVIYKIPSKPDMPLLHFSRNNLQDIILKDGSSIDPKFKTVNPYYTKTSQYALEKNAQALLEATIKNEL